MLWTSLPPYSPFFFHQRGTPPPHQTETFQYLESECFAVRRESRTESYMGGNLDRGRARRATLRSDCGLSVHCGHYGHCGHISHCHDCVGRFERGLAVNTPCSCTTHYCRAPHTIFGQHTLFPGSTLFSCTTHAWREEKERVAQEYL